MDAKKSRDDEIYKEGARIRRLLGVDADVYFSSTGSLRNSGPREYLVISFSECLRLAKAIARRLRDE